MRTTTVTLLFLSLLCCFQACAQAVPVDSAELYRSRISQLYRKAYDSLRKSDSMVYYSKGLQRVLRRTRGYSALSLYTTAGRADLSGLNASIAKDGFAPLNGPIWGVGLGYSIKADNGGIFDINFFTFGINRKSVKGDEAIKVSYSSVLQFQLGDAFVNTRVFSFYPFIGLSMRLSSVEYTKPQTVNSNWNSIASIVQNNQAVYVDNAHLSYQAGVGMDLLLTPRDRYGGIMLFGKFGTDGIFGNENYDIYGVKYSQGIRYGAWEGTIGLKFFGRR